GPTRTNDARGEPEPARRVRTTLAANQNRRGSYERPRGSDECGAWGGAFGGQGGAGAGGRGEHSGQLGGVCGVPRQEGAGGAGAGDDRAERPRVEARAEGAGQGWMQGERRLLQVVGEAAAQRGGVTVSERGEQFLVGLRLGHWRGAPEAVALLVDLGRAEPGVGDREH